MYRAFISGLCVTLTVTPVMAGQSGAIGPLVNRSAPPLRTEMPAVLPGTPAAAFSTIQGNALDSADGPLSGATVRLRDARLGRVVGTRRTDTTGLFEFPAVDPGSYIVELLSVEQTVVAASDLLHVNAGDALSAVVKLPARLSGLFGRSTPQAAVILGAAAASGVLATAVVGVDSSARR